MASDVNGFSYIYIYKTVIIPGSRKIKSYRHFEIEICYSRTELVLEL